MMPDGIIYQNGAPLIYNGAHGNYTEPQVYDQGPFDNELWSHYNYAKASR